MQGYVLNENLIRLFSACIEGEHKVENLRKQLCRNVEFNLISFFGLFNQEFYITSKDLQLFLKSQNIILDNWQIFTLIKQYSQKATGRLDFDDSQKFILPSTDELLKFRVIERNGKRELSEPLINLIAKLIKEEADLQNELEETKQVLYKSTNFHSFEAFEYLANGKSFISENSLGLLFERSNKKLGGYDFDAVLRRIAKDSRQGISYKDFLEFIIPFNVPEKIQTEPEVCDKGENCSTNQNEFLDESNNMCCDYNAFYKKNKLDVKRSENLCERFTKLFIVTKQEECQKQILSCFKCITFGLILHVLNTPEIPDDLKSLIKYKYSSNIKESIFQVLSPLDPDYKLVLKDKLSYTSCPAISSHIKSCFFQFAEVEKHIHSLSEYCESSLSMTRSESNPLISKSHLQSFLTSSTFPLSIYDQRLLAHRLFLNPI